ncbi:PQQ-dependent sugar dehydrogenase [Aquibacillus sp. LR5S19]|uniref:PQQ-dependent sugar dehydrogenase n=1 Tax=Aquibacillus rhizosphaerae TaxID=3051431 RepID=A0ABT7L2Q5_9BACI|nr:PQQ-dependent sugar dehydrogenase [Aquibacillus sp. LR5S19]MDL4840122.1 PQQ-dependent sugar dehydrogenase [Aquibacillus sp. LR5S19]
MYKILFFLFIAIFSLVACSESEEKNPSVETGLQESDEATTETNEIKVVATNLAEPWEIAEVNDVIYISERDGSIVKIENEAKTRKPLNLEKPLSDQSEAGLLGLAFPDSFSQDEVAYAYYSYSEGQDTFQRIITIEEQADQWIETGVLLDQIPGGRFHQGGRIEIGPDNKLYATTGDATNEDLAQDKESLAGKILRMNLDGSIPTDNPFSNSYVYSYGHRNPQGISWDEQGNLYATEHGNQAHDEINLIEPGNNYGWPEIEANQEQEGMNVPLVYSDEITWAPSGMDFFEGDFYFASLRGEALRRFDVDAETQEVVTDGYGRIRDVLSTEDGVYFITNNTDGRGNPIEEDDRLLFLNLE